MRPSLGWPPKDRVGAVGAGKDESRVKYARASRAHVKFNVLRPFDIRGPDGRVIGLPGGRVRSLLVFLLIQRGEVVSIDRIVDALWGEHAPGTAAKAVQGYVSRVRRVLEPDREPGDADGLIVARPPGYALRQDEVTVDATRFAKLAGEGRRALEDGSAVRRISCSDEALRSGGDRRSAEFAFDDFAQPEIRRWRSFGSVRRIPDRVSAWTPRRARGPVRLSPATYPLRGAPAWPVDAGAVAVVDRPTGSRSTRRSPASRRRARTRARAGRSSNSSARSWPTTLSLRKRRRLRRPLEHLNGRSTNLHLWVRRPSSASCGEGRTGAAVIAAALVAVLLMRNEAPGAVAIVTPAVVAVDPDTNRVVASIRVGSKPESLAGGEGAVWVGDARDGAGYARRSSQPTCGEDDRDRLARD